MRTVILSLALALLASACGGNSNSSSSPASPTYDPATTPPPVNSTTTTTTVHTTTTSEPNATPDGKCGVTTTTSATALDACNTECEKLSDKAPEGSRCLPPRVECKQGCKVKFEKK